MNINECEKCGKNLEFREEGSIQGLYCEKCGWLVVSTNLPQIVLDETEYTVYVINADHKNIKNVNLVSKIMGVNFLNARKLLQQQELIVFKGKATEILKVKEALEESRMSYKVTPLFTY